MVEGHCFRVFCAVGDAFGGEVGTADVGEGLAEREVVVYAVVYVFWFGGADHGWGDVFGELVLVWWLWLLYRHI